MEYHSCRTHRQPAPSVVLVRALSPAYLTGTGRMIRFRADGLIRIRPRRRSAPFDCSAMRLARDGSGRPSARTSGIPYDRSGMCSTHASATTIHSKVSVFSLHCQV